MGRSADHPVHRDDADDRRPHGGDVDGSLAHAPASELHVCPACGSELVHPVAWFDAGPGRWAVTRRCPNCEWYGDGVFSDEFVAAFDEELDRATEEIVRDLQQLTRANMEDEFERFVTALRADQVWPMDF